MVGVKKHFELTGNTFSLLTINVCQHGPHLIFKVWKLNTCFSPTVSREARGEAQRLLLTQILIEKDCPQVVRGQRLAVVWTYISLSQLGFVLASCNKIPYDPSETFIYYSFRITWPCIVLLRSGSVNLLLCISTGPSWTKETHTHKNISFCKLAWSLFGQHAKIFLFF